MQLITRLKTILNCKIFYIILLFLTFNLVVIKICFSKNESIYKKTNDSFLLKVSNYSFSENKLKIDFRGEEKLVGTYYIKSDYLLNNLKDSLEYGDYVFVKGSLNVPNNNTVPKAFNYRKYLNNKNIYYTLNIDSIEIRKKSFNLVDKLKNKINKRINIVDYHGYSRAFILGDKSGIPKQIYEKYQRIGIAHLFALSGMHVGLLSTLLWILLKNVKLIYKYLIVDFILIIYGFVVSFPFSILRCILFFILNNINKIFNLEISSFRILILVFSIICLINYRAVLDVGFWFSICTVWGIIIGKDFISDSNKVLQLIKLSLVAFLFSMPISLLSFYEINIFSVFYNIFFVPLVSLIIYPLSLLSFCLPFLNQLFIVMVNIMENVVNAAASFRYFSLYLDFNMIEIIIWYLLLIIIFKFKIYKLFLMLFLLILLDLSIPYFDNNLYVNYFDVGQGDASLIIDSNRKNVILIDTGGNSNTDEYKASDNYIRYMKSLGIKRIDTLIVTHGDFDHMGDAIHIVDNFIVKKVIFNCGEYNDLEKELIEVLDKKKIKYYSCIKELNMNKNKLYFLQIKEFDNENDNSNVIYTKLNGYKFMFMGDASIVNENEIMNKYNISNIDVFKVGHHGSKTSSSKEFINEIKPKYSIISVGKNNRYGHPNKEVLDNLKKSKIYRTDFNGSILFKVKNNKLYIETCNP